MQTNPVKRIILVSFCLLIMLLAIMFIGISIGSTGSQFRDVYGLLFHSETTDSVLATIVWQIRLPRVLLAFLVGATLSLGGLVFQALLRNPLAEPYILGISGGSAIGAIAGILLGLSYFPGTSILAFLGSTATLGLLLLLSSGQTLIKRNALLLSGVMVNAFCSAIIMLLVSMAYDTRLHNIIFWLMGNLSTADLKQTGFLMAILLPCFGLIFWLSNMMNLLLMGKDMAQTMGVHIKAITLTLLLTTSVMIGVTVSFCGLIGFVGLVVPHLLRLSLGSDHRVLVPACVLGGGAYLVFCDLLAKTIPQQGELPAGVITAMIGAPLFIILLKRSGQ